MKKVLTLMIVFCIQLQIFAQSWIALQTPANRNLYGCYFDPTNPDKGMAVGWYIQAQDRIPFGFYTNDGGANITSGSLFQIYFYASSDVWFTNFYNGIVVGNGIIQTTDGGTNWNLIVDAASTQAGILENVMFTNGTDGYAVGQRYDFNYTSMEGMLYKTSNAGGSWTDHTVSAEVNNENTLLHTVYSTGNGVIYAGAENTMGGGSTLFKSSDDGLTWSSLNFTQNIYSLFFTSTDTGFAASTNGLFRTTDAGLSWSNVITTSTPLHAIQIKERFGFTAGENGSIYMTTDNGAAWSPVTSPVSTTISDLYIVSPNLAYAVGTAGTFLKYTNTLGTQEIQKPNTVQCSIDKNRILSIEWESNTATRSNIDLINLQGAILKTETVLSTGGRNKIEWDMHQFSPRVYSVRLSGENEFRICKFNLMD